MIAEARGACWKTDSGKGIKRYLVNSKRDEKETNRLSIGQRVPVKMTLSPEPFSVVYPMLTVCHDVSIHIYCEGLQRCTLQSKAGYIHFADVETGPGKK